LNDIIINAKSFSIEGKIFESRYSNMHIDVDINLDTNNEIRDWVHNRGIINFILKHDNRYFLIEGSYITIVNINTEGRLSSCVVKFEKIEDVSRKYKIEKILKKW
jgi:hypothetical protein